VPRTRTAPTPSLAEEQRDHARSRILRAARQVLAERGLATRVDDVAAAAGVGRRTVFRHFETRDALLAAAVTDGMRSYGDHIPRPATGAALEEWLEEALVAVHGMNARHGRIYWELAFAPDLHGELADVAETRRQARRQLVRRFTDWAWTAGGGGGRPPVWLLDAFAVHLSAFATQALIGDFGRRPEEIGRSAARALSAAVRQAVAER
jgi:AcrR family transcriptional regulator